MGEADPARVSFTRQTGFFRCWDGGRAKEFPKNPYVYSPKWIFCLLSSEEAASSRSEQRAQSFCNSAAGAKENRDEIRKTRMPHLGWRNSPRDSFVGVRAVDSTGAGDRVHRGISAGSHARLVDARSSACRQRRRSLPLHAVSEQERTLSTSQELFACLRKRGKRGLGKKIRLQILSAYKTMRRF